MPKFIDCVKNAHGDCCGVCDLPYLTDDEVVFIDRQYCECWCHNNEDPFREPDNED